MTILQREIFLCAIHPKAGTDTDLSGERSLGRDVELAKRPPRLVPVEDDRGVEVRA